MRREKRWFQGLFDAPSYDNISLKEREKAKDRKIYQTIYIKTIFNFQMETERGCR